MSQFKYLLQKENLPNLTVLLYTSIKISYIHIDLTVFNRGNLLNLSWFKPIRKSAKSGSTVICLY